METARESLLILLSTPVYLLVIGLEVFLTNYQGRKAYTWKDTLSNIYLMILNSSIDLLFRAVYVFILVYAWQHRVTAITNAFWYWFALVIAIDFIYYWLHRIEHQVRLLWAVHVTHHSSELFNLTVGFRSSVFQPLYRFIFFLPLAFFGFDAIDIMFIHSAIQTWGILVHTSMVKNLGFIEHVLVTPSHHRVHHASNVRYLDRNMGMLLIFWDKLFGTFQPEMDEREYEPIRYGLTTNLSKADPINLVTHEWQAITADLQQPLPLKIKLKYLFAPPGWSHDGSRKTSDELRNMEADNN